MEGFKRLFGDGFRAFFMAAGIFAVAAVLVWEIWLGTQLSDSTAIALPVAIPAAQWHAHEMIFGYAGAAIGGFLMTAVPTWTGSAADARRFIVVAVMVWLAGRIAVATSGVLPPVLVAVVDLAFQPLVAARIAAQLVKRPKPQNLMFLLFVTLLWTSNLLVHLEWTGATQGTLFPGLRAGLLSLCAMISVLGGRVTPGFTRNAMKRDGVDESLWPHPPRAAAPIANGLTVLIPFLLLIGAPDRIVGVAALAAGIAQLVRLSCWRSAWTWRSPILAALHLSMLMLGVGLALWGGGYMGLADEVAGLHVLGIGAVGGMTLAVMSRAILGHTGRALVAPGPVAVAYGLIALSAVCRWFGSYLAGTGYLAMMLASGAIWITAFALFLLALGPAMLAPRLARQSP
ncbi:NnrS family protein [Sedimentitalea sp. JM2-8]|uniref:NnrS family protein n=1 Tax=Sedimentitalea xiamensis TaxID=3050037 RepID=A0ABT7FE47_9RHOB|nr:NnrS family protein [Sedimentitalea xiamensis]MDK3073335.1 NnrS family protein [Sedimentitalea xiamensis]